MPTWGAQIIPDTSPVHKLTVPPLLWHFQNVLPWDAQPIPDTSPVQQMTESLIKVAACRYPFWSAQIIPDASPVHKITVSSTLQFDQFSSLLGPGPFLIRAGCSKSRFREVG